MSIIACTLRHPARCAALILVALLGVSLLGACGQKGALKLPAELPKSAPADAGK